MRSLCAVRDLQFGDCERHIEIDGDCDLRLLRWDQMSEMINDMKNHVKINDWCELCSLIIHCSKDWGRWAMLVKLITALVMVAATKLLVVGRGI
eukprot:3668929-Pleurochrysis_carterae.AAC.1